MPVAAVPTYMGRNFSSASPGMRFGLFLDLWGVDSRTGKHLWTTHDYNYRRAGRNREERLFKDEQKTHAINKACSLSRNDKSIMEAAESRQRAIATEYSEISLFSVTAKSIAPFTTGLGNEHPLENGFSFLNPYGLPYLPGSGVKGVVRRAAEELASGDWGASYGWDSAGVYSVTARGGETIEVTLFDVLFGREPTSGNDKPFRGALNFWDVIPQICGSQLAVEVMTPHQTHYYQDGKQPHDSGSPNPISFLTVPPGSQFAFYVSCDLNRLKRVTTNSQSPFADSAWKALLAAAFEHAFEWLGFGAKTAVGYGAMELVRPMDGADKGDDAGTTAKPAVAEEAEAERIAAEQAEYDALPEFRKRIIALKKAQETFLASSRNGPEYDKAQARAKKLFDSGLEWPGAKEREEGAALLEATYDKIGWHRPGARSRQKRNQKIKRQQSIGRIRDG